MRLTRSGLAILIVAVGCIAAGRVFGTLELYLLGAIAAVALLLALISTSTTRLAIAISRTATPVRLRVGAPARVDLRLVNQSKRSTPVLRLRDDVEGTRAATLMLAPIAGGSEATVAYRLPTRRRGHLDVGPLDLTFEDPFGLTRSVLRASRAITLTVHAELIELEALQAVAGRDPTADQQKTRTLASGGDEFFALRPYVNGDELRRVHWRASARTGELVVRQDERPRTGRVTVLLDRQHLNYPDDTFERAVSAALSALHAAWRSDDALRFATSGTSRFADIRSRGELDAIDEQLALITTSDHASLITSIDELGKVGHGGTLVVVTGRSTRDLGRSIETAQRSFGTVITIICAPDAAELPPGSISFTDAESFADHWRERIPQRAGR
jgi:uncharacterized protein (DUF58 family)